MPKVFYTGHSRESPPPEREWASGDSASEAETDVESPAEVVQPRTRPKTVHRRTESMDAAPHAMPTAKRTRRAGNAVFRQRESSREIRDATGQRPLQKACSRGDYSRVLMLLERNNPDLQDRDYAGTTALHTAALQGDDRIVAALLRAGAVPDVRSGPEELDTPLMDAAANGFLPVVKLLLKYGADPRVTNAMGRIALDFVEEDEREDPDSVAIIGALTRRMFELRREGAPLVDSPTHPLAPQGLFPPGFAGVQRPAAPAFLDLTRRSTREEIIEHASMGNLEYVGSALERGWRPSGDALVKAARYGHAEIVGLLLAFGLDANTKVGGTTPLREAIKRDHVATAKLLLESGSTAGDVDKKLVADLPPHDELRALVLGVTPGPVPENLKTHNTEQARKNPQESNSDHAESSKRRSLSPPAMAAESGRRTREPISRLKKSSATSGSSSPRDGAPKDGSPRDSSPKSSPAPDTKPTLKTETVKPVQSEPSGLKSSKSDFELSKLDLRSIKPKKKPKSVPEPIPEEHNALEPIVTSLPTKLASPSPTSPGTSLKDHTRQEQSEGSNGAAPDSDSTAFTPSSDHVPTASISPTNTSGAGLTPENQPASVEQPTGLTKEVSPLTEVAPAGKEIPVTSNADATNSLPANGPPSRERSPGLVDLHRDSQRESPTPSEAWVERSQELRQLAERKQKERRDREARMLQSLAEEQRRRSESETQAQEQRRSSDAASESATSTPRHMSPAPNEPEPVAATTGQPSVEPSPSVQPEDEVQAPGVAEKEKEVPVVSVKSFPWALRKLAYTGRSQPAAPLYRYEVNGAPSYVDMQVSLATGDVGLHSRFPGLAKTVISTHHKLLLWPFCRAWVCRAGAGPDEVEDDRKKFVDLPLAWIPVSEVDARVFEGMASRPSAVSIQLELKPLPQKHVTSEQPLWWQSRLSKPGRAW